MAAPTHQDNGPIAAINVTPLVDVVLVLLVVLMVTATTLVSRTLPVNLPKAATGESHQALLALTIDAKGQWWVDARPTTEPELRHLLRARSGDELRALVAADGAVPHREVVALIDLLRQEGVTELAFSVSPSELRGK